MDKKKEEKAGYITWMSPPKSCNNGRGIQFDFNLQDDENTSTKVRGFGKSTLKTLKPFHEGKSPVKMQLFKDEKYQNPYSISERCPIEAALHQDVPFQFNMEVSSSSLLSKEIDLTTLLASGDESSYYTVNGKVNK